VWSAEYVPATGSPAVLTLTLRSVPPAPVTVIPFDGSAFAAFPGVIVTTGPAGWVAGGEVGRRGVPGADALPDAEAGLDAEPMLAAPVVLPELVQAATVTVSAAPAATAESVRIALMPTRYLMAC
jgi:hypothetical protein